MKPITPATATQPRCVIGLRVEQAVDRLPAGDDRAEQDDANDDDPGQVLDPAEAVGEARRRRAARQRERDPERDRGAGIAEVVDRVGEERDAARENHDDKLQRRRDRQDDERPFDRPDAAPVVAIDGSITP